MTPPSAVNAAGLALTPLYAWLFIFRLGLGLDGAAYAWVATQVPPRTGTADRGSCCRASCRRLPCALPCCFTRGAFTPPLPWLQASMAAMLGGYILVRDRRLRGQEQATWHGWSAEALHGWPTYLR